MGQKVNPIGLRIGVNKNWESNWFAPKNEFGTLLNKDIKIRKYIETKLKDAAVASVIIERTAKRTEVKIYTAKPGVIIGRGGEDIEKLRKALKKLVDETCGSACIEVYIDDEPQDFIEDSVDLEDIYEVEYGDEEEEEEED